MKHGIGITILLAALSLAAMTAAHPATTNAPAADEGAAPAGLLMTPAPLDDQSCGNQRCEPPEDCNTCPQDCGDCCGNRRCEPPEDCDSCPADCC